MSDERILLVLHIRRSRARSRLLAAMEALCVLDGLDVSEERGGPLGEAGPVVWVSVPRRLLDEARERLPRLGYSTAVDVVESRRPLHARRIHDEDAAELRSAAVDRRAFLIDTGDGPREVRGYRGGSGSLSRRGLAVPDARLLVNLVTPGGSKSLLDPFAGAGGLVIESVRAGNDTASADLDPVVGPGLARLTDGNHVNADVTALPHRSRTFDGVGGETPFDESADGAIAASLPELCRVTRHEGRVVLMCPERQAECLRSEAATTGVVPFVDEPVDRKGIPVMVIGWTVISV